MCQTALNSLDIYCHDPLGKNSEFCLLEFCNNVCLRLGLGPEPAASANLCLVSHKLYSFLTISALHLGTAQVYNKV